MDPELRAEVSEALATDRSDSRAIASALTKRGFPVREGSVRVHRQENHKDRSELR